ncbi:MAG: hypothetical protein P1U85_02200 [Verrucomicrobiales bacterium]|nr:hypothetical protein [Verrucomicrobiales bacterium]
MGCHPTSRAGTIILQDLSLIHAVSVYRKNHKVYMRETRQGETRDFTEWHWENGRPITNLYRASR